MRRQIHDLAGERVDFGDLLRDPGSRSARPVACADRGGERLRGVMGGMIAPQLIVAASTAQPLRP